MPLKIPFYKPEREPMLGLLEHYGPIAKSMTVVEETLTGYLSGETGRTLQVLTAEMDTLEAEADKIKRRIRNHLPNGLLMAVSKTLFLNYTSRQDDILDFAQEAQNWLAMRRMSVDRSMHDDLLALAEAVSATVGLLKPALESTVGLVHGDHKERGETKERIHAVRDQHLKAAKLKFRVVSGVMNSDTDFRDTYQLLKYAEALHNMSHSAEECANILRAMIAR